MNKKAIKRNLGFTLIELLVVISIISLLSSIVLATLSDARDKAKLSAVKETVVQLRNQAEIYYSQYNNYGMDEETQYYYSYDFQEVDDNRGFFAEPLINEMIVKIQTDINSPYVAYAITPNSWAIAFSVDQIVAFELAKTVYAASEGQIQTVAGEIICVDSSGNFNQFETDATIIENILDLSNEIVTCI